MSDLTSNGQNSTFVSPGNGISGGYEGDDTDIRRAMMSFTAIAWYNSIELIILVFVVFKRYRGAYFWSLLITSLSIIIYSFGAWGKLVSISRHNYFPVTFTTVGWIVMVTGQSIVLWSRLHLITQNEKLLRGILWAIVINSILMCTPTAVLTFGSNSMSSNMEIYIRGYSIMERIQMTAFSVLEVFISSVYLWEVRKLLKVVYEGQARNLMWQIISINVAIIALDIALLSVEYIDLYQIEITLKGMVYSIKLKLEFAVLSKLVKIITKRQESGLHASEEENTQLDADLAKLTPIYTRETAGSLGTATTLRGSDTNATSNRSGSESLKGRMLSSTPMVGLTAQEVLQGDFATSPSALEACEGGQPKRQMRRSSEGDFYPGRLV